MERARYRQSDLRRMALGVRTIPSLFIALTSYKLLAVLLLMETFLLPGTFVVGGLALPACTLLFLACSLVCLAFAMLFRRLTFHDHGWYLGLLIACLMLGLFLLLLREHEAGYEQPQVPAMVVERQPAEQHGEGQAHQRCV